MPRNMIDPNQPLNVQTAKIRHQMAGVVLKCWQDPAFKAALIANPKEVLKAEGVLVNPDIEYVFVADEPPKLHFIIPAPPIRDSLTHEEMLQVAHAGEQLILPSIIC